MKLLEFGAAALYGLSTHTCSLLSTLCLQGSVVHVLGLIIVTSISCLDGAKVGNFFIGRSPRQINYTSWTQFMEVVARGFSENGMAEYSKLHERGEESHI